MIIFGYCQKIDQIEAHKIKLENYKKVKKFFFLLNGMSIVKNEKKK